MRVAGRDVILALCWLLILLVLHFDFWRPSPPSLLGGWLPAELAYRLAHMLLSWLFLMFVCSRVWQPHEP